MKKSIFLLLATGTMLFAACSKDSEELKGNGFRINETGSAGVEKIDYRLATNPECIVLNLHMDKKDGMIVDIVCPADGLGKTVDFSEKYADLEIPYLYPVDSYAVMLEGSLVGYLPLYDESLGSFRKNATGSCKIDGEGLFKFNSSSGCMELCGGDHDFDIDFYYKDNDFEIRYKGTMTATEIKEESGFLVL